MVYVVMPYSIVTALCVLDDVGQTLFGLSTDTDNINTVIAWYYVGSGVTAHRCDFSHKTCYYSCTCM